MQKKTKRKTLQELTIKDNFMFGAVMMEEENCRQFLELVLGFPIEKVTVDKEKSMVYNPEHKGVRLDILAKDEARTHYNIEMQTVPQSALGKRSRYYQSQLDMELLLEGEPYSVLPDTYVIFICDFDPFGEKRYRYTFENRCLESDTLRMEDGKTSIFLSTHGQNEAEEIRGLVKFLQYVKSDLTESEQDYEDAFVRKLQQTVKQIKTNREIGARYMTWNEMLAEERDEGKIEGRIEGRIEAVFELLEDLGAIPEDLKQTIWEQEDLAVIKAWLKLAAKAGSVEEFMERMQKEE